MPADTPPPGTGPAGKGKKKLTREQKIMLGTAGGGAALALLVLARRGSKGGAGGGEDGGLATTGQPYVQPAQYSDAGISAYNNLQSEIERLGGRIDDLADVGQQTPTPVVPTPTTPAAGHALSGPWRPFIIRKGQSILDLVTKSHPAWSLAERQEAARQIAIYNKRPGMQTAKFTADRTVYLR